MSEFPGDGEWGEMPDEIQIRIEERQEAEWDAKYNAAPTTPHALTREQVEHRCKNVRDIGHLAWEARELEDHDAALRQALAQQAQRIQELDQKTVAMAAMLSAATKRQQDDACMMSLSGMQVEQYARQLAASQARIMELKEMVERDTSRILKYQSQVLQLQAALAERERDVDNLASQINDAHKAIERLETERDTARQDAARLRMLIFRLLNDLPTKRDWLDPDLEQTLKGA